MTISFNVSFVTAGYPIEKALDFRSKKLKNYMVFASNVVRAFSVAITNTSPRDTGYMADTMAKPSLITLGGEFVGWGVGAYGKIGDPAKRAKKGTIKEFVEDYPKLRGHRPMIATAAWWSLSKAGKNKLKFSRLHNSYGGGKPAYWYAIASGLVPDADGGTLPAHVFVNYAIDFADAELKRLAPLYFGG